MKKLFFLITFYSFIHSLAAFAQEADEFPSTATLEKSKEQIAQQLENTLEPVIENIGSVLNSFLDTFSSIQVMGEVCHEEDAKSPHLTTNQAEEIVRAIIPDNWEAFSISLQDAQIENFANGKFSIDNTSVEIEMAKSYCLSIIDDMIEIFKQMPLSATNELNKTLSTQNTSEEDNQKQSYNVCGDDIKTSKFNQTNINNMKILRANISEEQKAYAIIYFGTLGIRIKAQGGDYEKTIENIIQKIDTAQLQKIIGQETTAEIRERLRKKSAEIISSRHPSKVISEDKTE